MMRTLTARVAMLAAVLMLSLRAYGIGEKQFVVFSASTVGFTIVDGKGASVIVVDDGDWAGVVRAAGDLSLDIERVSGVRASLLQDGKAPAQTYAIVIGTIGKSRLIDSLIERHRLDVAEIQGKWESTVTQVVDHPFPNVDKALVIAGSDKRGTIFGIYELSEQMGVSPWYWWADVRIRHHDTIGVLPGRYVQGEPAVKYRGIFLNDESPALTGWAKHTFGDLNSQFYGHVFELLLRLRANSLWPAMWGNAFNEDDPENPKLADMYGIVMGTSHHEPMLRSQQEWKRHGTGAWDYTTNSAELRSFWKAGVDRNKNYESLITVGMRGDGDKPMSATDDVGLLEKIVHDQLEIVRQEQNPTLNLDPKVWALYKEVQGYYEKGMRVPDDVTLLWADDNWGNIRRLPTAEERKRSGGAGIYYHFDYVGGPRSYTWINTNAIAKVWEQMHLALEYGADRLWIVNVGDLKPMEFPMEFFLNYARDPQRWSQDKLHEYTVAWATREFGPENAEEIASEVEDYQRYISRRKPELLDPTTFSLGNFQEAARVEAEWESLRKRVDTLGGALPEEEKASFFELVQHPVEAAATVTEMYVAAGWNAVAAKQGRAVADDYAARTRFLFEEDQKLSDKYNHELLNGRWVHMMDQPHIGYVSWNSPSANVMPAVTAIHVPDAGELGVAVGVDAGAKLALGEFDSVSQQTKPLTLFNKGKSPVKWHLKADQPWVLLAQSDGMVTKQADVPVRIDWKAAPQGIAQAEIAVYGEGGEISRVTLTARRQDVTREAARGFVEGDGYVSIEAGDFFDRTGAGDVRWVELPGYGRTKSAMTTFPVTAASDMSSNVELAYPVHLYDTGVLRLQCILAPTLNFAPGRGLRFAVSVDDGPRQIVDALERNTDRDWSVAVRDNAKTVNAAVTVAKAGDHVIHVWYVDPGVVLEKLVLSKPNLPATYLGPPESFHGAVPASRDRARAL